MIPESQRCMEGKKSSMWVILNEIDHVKQKQCLVEIIPCRERRVYLHINGEGVN